MGLPKLEHPTFELELPSTQEKIKYRPFLVKEQKILMLGMSTSEDFPSLIIMENIVM